MMKDIDTISQLALQGCTATLDGNAHSNMTIQVVTSNNEPAQEEEPTDHGAGRKPFSELLLH